MNPLNWKREHRFALAVAGAIGGIAGLVFAYLLPGPTSRGGVFGFLYQDFFGLYEWLTYSFWPVVIVVGWALLGATLSCAAVYARQLLRL